MSVLFGAFAMSACGPMNHQANGGLGSATVNAGGVDAAKDLGTKKNSYLISVKFLGTLQAGQLPQGNDQFLIRVLHPDLSPLGSTEMVGVQFYSLHHSDDPVDVPPNQGVYPAALQTQADGSVLATMVFDKPAKRKIIEISVTNSAEASQSDQKYVEYQVN